MEKEDAWLLKIFIDKEWWFVSKVGKNRKMEVGNKFEMGKRYKTKEIIEKQIEAMKEDGWKALYEIVSLQEEAELARLKAMEENRNESDFMKRLKDKKKKDALQKLQELLGN